MSLEGQDRSRRLVGHPIMSGQVVITVNARFLRAYAFEAGVNHAA